MYVIPRNIEVSEHWIVNFINKNLTPNFNRNSTESNYKTNLITDIFRKLIT